jgi:site-specific DNA-methyltransferase (adenine-specific)
MNTIYLGDCLDVLRDNVADESVDLIYIDPPFNSKRNYNIFFDSKEIQTQHLAFEDTWTLKNIQDSLTELHTLQHDSVYTQLLVYQKYAPQAFPYLTMMSLRLLELHRVLKQTGSLYLHCDPTMSHYLKVMCDIVFGEKNFRNEIVWCYRKWAIVQKQFVSNHDVILFYAKSSNNTFNIQFVPPGAGTMKRWKGKKHKRLMFDGVEKTVEIDEPIETPAFDWWEMGILNANSNERLGYPTQKPKALLERIIKASSNKNDVVLDAFCGCGTSIDAAEGLNRKWIGIDISPIAVSLIKRRLIDTYKSKLSKYEIRGTPSDEASARRLWVENPFAFQDWWITEFEAFSSTFGTKGADKGVDGIALYAVDNKGSTTRAAFQVKGGEKVESKDIDALLGAMQKHKCDLGVFLTIAEPTKPMLDTISASGFVEFGDKQHKFVYPKLQALTIKDFFSNKRLKLPDVNITFKSAEHKGKISVEQLGMEM